MPTLWYEIEKSGDRCWEPFALDSQGVVFISEDGDISKSEKVKGRFIDIFPFEEKNFALVCFRSGVFINGKKLTKKIRVLRDKDVITPKIKGSSEFKKFYFSEESQAKCFIWSKDEEAVCPVCALKIEKGTEVIQCSNNKCGEIYHQLPCSKALKSNKGRCSECNEQINNDNRFTWTPEVLYGE